MLIINLHEQQAYTFVQFSDLAKNWQFCTPIIVNISIPPPLNLKIWIYKESSENALNVCGYKNWIRGWGVCELNDVITTDMKSAGIHLLNYYSFIHIQPSTG